jgi:hypothetical protein
MTAAVVTIVEAADRWAQVVEDIAAAEDRRDRDRESWDQLDGELGDAETALLNAVQRWRKERCSSKHSP